MLIRAAGCDADFVDNLRRSAMIQVKFYSMRLLLVLLVGILVAAATGETSEYTRLPGASARGLSRARRTAAFRAAKVGRARVSEDEGSEKEVCNYVVKKDFLVHEAHLMLCVELNCTMKRQRLALVDPELGSSPF